MPEDPIRALIDDATFDFTMGEHETAVAKLLEATSLAPDRSEAWHALAEVQLHRRALDEALAAAERAHALAPDDLLINTTLSRVWVERGDKAQAEKFGARAKVLGWKEQLQADPHPPPPNPPGAPGSGR
jgi:Flp pilus assembly protein TadD